MLNPKQSLALRESGPVPASTKSCIHSGFIIPVTLGQWTSGRSQFKGTSASFIKLPELSRAAALVKKSSSSCLHARGQLLALERHH